MATRMRKAKDTSSHVFWRNGRAWAHFAREYEKVVPRSGDGRPQLRIPLIVEGEKFATRDPEVAKILLSRHLTRLDDLRRRAAIQGVSKQATLAQLAAAHLKAKRDSGKFSHRWLWQAEAHLNAAVAYFGALKAARLGIAFDAENPPAIDLLEVDTEAVRAWIRWLSEQDGRGGRKMSGATQRKYVNSLSNLFKRAISEGYVKPGANPVSALLDKPQPEHVEAEWLEVSDAALYLEAARLYNPPEGQHRVLRFMYPLVATFLLTGARESEVCGLLISDVSFDKRTVTIRRNEYRPSLKTAQSARVIPLWPQLLDILRAYLDGPLSPRRRFGGDAGLLFPSPLQSKQALLTNIDKSLDSIAALCGWTRRIRTKMFRHTYTAARLQTLDHGQPVSVFTVARELGHRKIERVEEVYGHLGEIRHRSEVVEYRVEQHAEKLKAALDSLRRKVAPAQAGRTASARAM